MPDRLRPFKVSSHRPIAREKKPRDEWQKIVDEQTAKQFEQYVRLKRAPALASLGFSLEIFPREISAIKQRLVSI
jgi:hypothetical protein